jgi:hypothetical protein
VGTNSGESLQIDPQTNNPLSFFPDFAWRNVVILTSEQSSSATWLDNLLARELNLKDHSPVH